MDGLNHPFVPAPLLLCQDCDLPHALSGIVPGHRAECARCGAVLRHFRSGGLERAAALTLAALVLFVIANLFPLLTFEMEGREQPATLVSGAIALWQGGYAPLGLLVAFVLLLAPLLELTATLYVVLPLLFGRRLPGAAAAYRLVSHLRPWAMAEVFLLGMIVAYVKLSSLATLVPGPSLAALVGFILVQIWGEASISPFAVWERLAPQTRAGTVAEPDRLARCHDCGQAVAVHHGMHHGHGLHPGEVHLGHCPRCGAGLHRRKPDSVRRCWALVLSAVILYVPANLLPIMTVIYFGAGEPDTILSGVRSLIEAQMWPIALLVFFASILVPVLKLVGLAYLLVSVRHGSPRRLRERTRLYRLIEGIGRWSMVDIFMIALLTALVKLGAIASVEADLGAVAFGAVVIITMLASHAFDPRLMWDAAAEGPAEGSATGGDEVRRG